MNRFKNAVALILLLCHHVETRERVEQVGIIPPLQPSKLSLPTGRDGLMKKARKGQDLENGREHIGHSIGHKYSIQPINAEA